MLIISQRQTLLDSRCPTAKGSAEYASFDVAQFSVLRSVSQNLVKSAVTDFSLHHKRSSHAF
jgi:hypothetical protein